MGVKLDLIARWLKYIFVVMVYLLISSMFKFAYNPYAGNMRVYNANGLIDKQFKIFDTILTPSTASGFSVDMSSAGFTQTPNVQVQVEYNTSTATAVPVASIKTVSSTTVTFNILQSNTGVIGILAGLQFLLSTSGVKLHIIAIGN